MNKTRKLKCNFNTVTRKKLFKKHSLPYNFDLFNIRYTEPHTKDIAIGLVYFNSAKSKRLLMNYLYVLEKYKVAGIPTYTIEMYDDTPEIKDAVHVKTDFILFQKERLCYILEKHIPEKYTKLLFIDTDVVFDNINWYNDLSKKLDTFNIVQPFKNAIWLDITYKKVLKSRVSVVFYNKFGIIKKSGALLGGYHPGFGWGFQRTWYRKYGFFQYGILGGGDRFSCTSWMNKTWYKDYIKSKSYILPVLKEYINSIDIAPSICYINTSIYHLWHGSKKNRQYETRDIIFKSIKDIRDILTVEPNGLFALKDSASSLKPLIRKYFKNRDDDGVENSIT